MVPAASIISFFALTVAVELSSLERMFTLVALITPCFCAKLILTTL